MKNSSKVKYFGAVAAALLAVAPIAAPVVSQIAAPAVAQAADVAAPVLNPTQAFTSVGSSSEQAGVMAAAKAALPSRTIANTDSASVNSLIGMVQNIKPSTNSNDAVPYNRFFNNSYTNGNPFVSTTADSNVASGFNAQTTDGSKASAFTYTISGGNIPTGTVSQDAIIAAIDNAKYAGKAITYTVTVTGYDYANNQIVKLDASNSNPFSFNVTITPSATATNNAAATFKDATIQAPTAAPGAVNELGSVAGDISIKGASGTAYTVNANNDLQYPAYYAKAGAQLGDASVTWAKGFDAALTNVPAIQNSVVDGQWTKDAIFSQAVYLSNGSTNVANLKADLVNGGKLVGGAPITATAAGYVADANGNQTSLYWNAGQLILVRQITVKADEYNSLLPKVLYQNAAKPTAPVQYTDGQTVSLNTGDWNSLNAPYTDNTGRVVNNTDSISELATALLAVTKGNLKAYQNAAADSSKATPIASSVTAANAKALITAEAKKAGLTISSDNDTFTKGGSFTVPVTYKNDAGYVVTVYLPLTGMTQGQTQDIPTVEYRNGSKQDITLTVGDTFDYAKDMTVYTDAAKTQTIDPAYWTVTPKTIDTSKPGEYDVTYTFTNPANGQSTTVKRHVTVKGEAKTSFENTNGVISIQTSKAPQYTYDATSDSFKVADSYTQLKLASAWKYNQKATASNGDVYYRVSANGYVKGSDVTTAKVTPQFGVVTVNNDNGTKTYANTTKDSGAVQSIKPDTSWKFFAVAVNPDGSRAYLVADNQWIPASDVVERVQAASGVFTVGSDAAPTFNGSGSVVKGKTLKARSAWKVTGVKNINGQPYYRIATDLYVRADYGSYAK